MLSGGTNDQGWNDDETKNRRPAACPISHAKLAASEGAGATCAHGCTACVPTFADSTGHKMSQEASCRHDTLIFQHARAMPFFNARPTCRPCRRIFKIHLRSSPVTQ